MNDVPYSTGVDFTQEVRWDCGSVLYYAKTGSDRQTGFRDAPALAARLGGGLDPLAIAEEAAVGFQVGNRTLFRGIERRMDWGLERAEGGLSCGAGGEGAASSTRLIGHMTDVVCSAFESGVAIEATGGLDSRLLLAFGIAKGAKPRIAFTIGDKEHGDVRAASTIASHFKFTHVRLDLVVDRERITNDARDMIRASGYSINPASYAWLPATLSPLDKLRTAQMSGAAGEVVGSFYYTPFDNLVKPMGIEALWLRKRLLRPWIKWPLLWGTARARELEHEMLRDLREHFDISTESWREKADAFYRNQRIQRWGLPVLFASRQYYDVVAPYLSPVYFGWAKSLSVEQRIGRTAQWQILREVHPELAAFGRERSGARSSKLVGVARKVARRVGKWHRSSALGTVQTARALFAEHSVKDSILTMIHESDVGFDPSGIDQILSHPDAHPELAGVLLAASVAWDDLRSAASQV